MIINSYVFMGLTLVLSSISASVIAGDEGGGTVSVISILYKLYKVKMRSLSYS